MFDIALEMLATQQAPKRHTEQHLAD